MRKLPLLLFLLVILTACSLSAYQPKPADQAETETEAETQTVPPDTSITILGTGDVLMHNTVIDSGRQGGEYSFEHLYAPVQHLVDAADHASLCLETALAGPASGYTGYPLFNSPDALALALKTTGFDLINTAGNHCMDRGLEGGVRTLQVLREAGLDTIGTSDSAETAAHLYIKEVKGFKLAYLAYSFSTNGIPVPSSAPWYFSALDREKILADIAAVRPEADLVILLLHWGVEYSPSPTAEQTSWAREFCEAGADLILGSHPHVIQPAELLDINGQKKLVVYSMGNSIGHQIGVERNSGVLVSVEFTRYGVDGSIRLSDYHFEPTYLHHYYQDGRLLFRAVPITETIENIHQGNETVLTEGDIPVLQSVYQSTMNTLQNMGLEL